MLERKQLKDRTQVTFVLPEDTPEGPVSVVGDFNHWNPLPTPFKPRATAPARRPSRCPPTARTPSATSPPATTGSTTTPPTATKAPTAGSTPEPAPRTGATLVLAPEFLPRTTAFQGYGMDDPGEVLPARDRTILAKAGFEEITTRAEGVHLIRHAAASWSTGDHHL
ncbi:hypothetical protein [Streptomyces sp. NPDC086989]|uniref:hypothetical protein n=1 Tax=Streptomyces sp. NPDC086989 TaxID=3365764 RepID=UPI00381B65EA